MPFVSTAAIVALSTVVAAGPVQTYTANPPVSRSEGLRTTRHFLPGADPDNGNLLTPAPWPDGRTDSIDRPERGRLWVPRVPIGTRTPLAEIARRFPGAADFGAPVDALEEVIFVQPDVPRAPVIAISPWEDVTARITDQLEDQVPYLGRERTDLRAPTILHDLVEAQHLWLKQQGYILNVRTHKNPVVVHGREDRAESPAEIQPRAVIRVHPPEPGADKARKQADASEPNRSSLPAPAPRIVVVRESQEAEQASAE